VRPRGPSPLSLLPHPAAVKHVLQDKAANYPRPPFVRDRLQAIVGGGLVGAEGPDWVPSRRMAPAAFRRHPPGGYGRQFAEATGEVLDSWAGYAETGRPLEVESEMVRVSLANLAASLFQTDWGGGNGRARAAAGGGRSRGARSRRPRSWLRPTRPYPRWPTPPASRAPRPAASSAGWSCSIR